MFPSPTSTLARLKSLLGLSSAGGIWRLLALIFALLNLKSWPFVWHLRLLATLTRHILLSPPSFHHNPPHTHTAPLPLFAPIITTTRSPFLECDYNLHKSNSTYFSDLDIARSHLVTALCARGMGIVHQNIKAEERAGGKQGIAQGQAGGGMVKVMLGGVHAAFRREIAMYQPYEIWTRVLAWDRKWLYIVSHFVEKGAVRPSGCLLQQTGRRSAQRKAGGRTTATGDGNVVGVGGDAKAMGGDAHPAILASSIAKYVFKKGRVTVAPARVLHASGLLPAELASCASLLLSSSAADDAIPATASTTDETGLEAKGSARTLAVEAVQSLIDGSLTAGVGVEDGGGAGGEWSWQDVERERVRGMEVAGLMGALDVGLVGEFRVQGEDGGEVLGMYWG